MIIVVSGLPGTGKSYFAEKLSGRLGAVHFNSDKMRNALHVRGKYTIGDKLHIYIHSNDNTETRQYNYRIILATDDKIVLKKVD